MNDATLRPRILIVDDDADLRYLLSQTLGRAGYDVNCASGGQEALEAFETLRPALIVLDVMMPDVDGWRVLRDLRSRSDVPVIMLTALSRDADQVHGLDGGADDYMTKPFSPDQLVARVRAVLRRSGHSGKMITRGPLTIDPMSREAVVDGRTIALTRREFALLEVLARNPGRAFSRAELLSRCWETDYTGVDRVVDVHLASLRRKLGKRRNLISTVRGIGYKLDIE